MLLLLEEEQTFYISGRVLFDRGICQCLSCVYRFTSTSGATRYVKREFFKLEPAAIDNNDLSKLHTRYDKTLIVLSGYLCPRE